MDASYEERLALRDGTPVTLRCVRPGDKELLAAGLARMSPRSRYQRFFEEKDRLTDAELRYLTEVDGHDHFAIIAVHALPGGGEEAFGIARFVRTAEAIAEPAIAVIDDAQGKGLGAVLLRRLTDAAIERGIQRFRAQFHADNDVVQRLFGEAVTEVSRREDGSTVVADFELHETGAGEPMRRAFSEAARGNLWLTYLRQWMGRRR